MNKEINRQHFVRRSNEIQIALPVVGGLGLRVEHHRIAPKEDIYDKCAKHWTSLEIYRVKPEKPNNNHGWRRI